MGWSRPQYNDGAMFAALLAPIGDTPRVDAANLERAHLWAEKEARDRALQAKREGEPLGVLVDVRARADLSAKLGLRIRSTRWVCTWPMLPRDLRGGLEVPMLDARVVPTPPPVAGQFQTEQDRAEAAVEPELAFEPAQAAIEAALPHFEISPIEFTAEDLRDGLAEHRKRFEALMAPPVQPVQFTFDGSTSLAGPRPAPPATDKDEVAALTKLLVERETNPQPKAVARPLSAMASVVADLSELYRTRRASFHKARQLALPRGALPGPELDARWRRYSIDLACRCLRAPDALVLAWVRDRDSLFNGVSDESVLAMCKASRASGVVGSELADDLLAVVKADEERAKREKEAIEEAARVEATPVATDLDAERLILLESDSEHFSLGRKAIVEWPLPIRETASARLLCVTGKHTAIEVFFSARSSGTVDLLPRERRAALKSLPSDVLEAIARPLEPCDATPTADAATPKGRWALEEATRWSERLFRNWNTFRYLSITDYGASSVWGAFRGFGISASQLAALMCEALEKVENRRPGIQYAPTSALPHPSEVAQRVAHEAARGASVYRLGELVGTPTAAQAREVLKAADPDAFPRVVRESAARQLESKGEVSAEQIYVALGAAGLLAGGGSPADKQLVSATLEALGLEYKVAGSLAGKDRRRVWTRPSAEQETA